MSEKKIPQRGDWYRDTRSGGVIRVVGVTGCNEFVFESAQSLFVLAVGMFWIYCEHLPGCTGFDWVEPPAEVWPMYYVSRSTEGYFRRDSETVHVWVNPHGKETIQDAEASILDCKTAFREVSPVEALSSVIPPAPIESPDDWVTQDRVPDRYGIDEWRWGRHDGSASPWYKSAQRANYMHGRMDGTSKFEVRCRRKDLPPLPEPKVERVPVRLWISSVNGNVIYNKVRGFDEDDEIKFDANGFYVEATR